MINACIQYKLSFLSFSGLLYPLTGHRKGAWAFCSRISVNESPAVYVSILRFNTVLKCTSAVLWQCPGTSHYYQNTFPVLLKPSFEIRTLHFSASSYFLHPFHYYKLMKWWKCKVISDRFNYLITPGCYLMRHSTLEHTVPGDLAHVTGTELEDLRCNGIFFHQGFLQTHMATFTLWYIDGWKQCTDMNNCSIAQVTMQPSASQEVLYV